MFNFKNVDLTKQYQEDVTRAINFGTSIFNSNKNVAMDIYNFYSDVLQNKQTKDLNKLINSVNTGVLFNIEETNKFVAEQVKRATASFPIK